MYDHLFHQKKVPIWLDEHEMEPGDLLMRTVDRAIRKMDRIVLLCSEASLNSWWVREEIERWTERERQLTKQHGENVSLMIPVDLDGYLFDCDHEYASTIRKAVVLDAKGWDQDAAILQSAQDRLQRVLRRDRRTPLQHLQETATRFPPTDDDGGTLA